MKRSQYKQVIREKKQADSGSYLYEVLDNEPERAKRFLDEGNIEPLLYLNEFFEKLDDKEFYRTFERIKSGSYEKKELNKAIHSVCTHLYIEQEKNDVPQSVFEYIYEQLEKIKDENYEKVWNEISKLI